MGVQSSFGFTLGRMEKGRLNKITDVPGVRVGHVTRHEGDINTGVTAILPHTGDMFHDKCPAASHVINGFGKSIGLVQVNELGTIETPLLLTNTLSVGTAATALVKYMLERNADIGCDTGTVNPMVFECNDGHLNDIRGLHVTEQNALDALANAADDFEEGAVGAGSGMSCYSLKGGIGSASRVFELYGNKYTVGALLLTNFGTLRDLTIGGERVGRTALSEKGGRKGRRGAAGQGQRYNNNRNRRTRIRKAASARCPPGAERHSPHRQHIRQRLGRNCPRLHHRQPHTALFAQKAHQHRCALRGRHGPYVPRGDRVR